VINPKFVREWSNRNFVLCQVVVFCDGNCHTLTGVIDNLLQSLDSSMEISELLSQKETPTKKKRVVEDSSSSEEEERCSRRVRVSRVTQTRRGVEAQRVERSGKKKRTC